MEMRVKFGDLLISLTTGADRYECQQWEWWDEADVIISVDDTGYARVLKGD